MRRTTIYLQRHLRLLAANDKPFRLLPADTWPPEPDVRDARGAAL